MDSNKLLLGVTGGDSTEAVITTLTGTVLGRGLGPASNHHRVGLENARNALRTTLDRAAAQAQARTGGAHAVNGHADPQWIRDSGISAAVFGLSGVDGPEDEELFSSWLTSMGCKYKFLICNDSELILGGTPEGWGIALISGTGSICVGRSEQGRTVRVGGWGHLLGDEGSGFFMATEALKMATQAADGRRGSVPLLQAALEHWKLREPKELIKVVYKRETTSEDVASFATRVLDLATKNEPSARAVVEHAAASLAEHVDAVVERLGLKSPPLALAGRMMRMSFKRMILGNVKNPLGPVSIVSDSSQGAIATARRLLESAA
jgi:N-acetylglucosamine kinase-like BadF-type ATPase